MQLFYILNHFPFTATLLTSLSSIFQMKEMKIWQFWVTCSSHRTSRWKFISLQDHSLQNKFTHLWNNIYLLLEIVGGWVTSIKLWQEWKEKMVVLLLKFKGNTWAGRGLFGCSVDWKQRAETVKPHGAGCEGKYSVDSEEKRRAADIMSEGEKLESTKMLESESWPSRFAMKEGRGLHLHLRAWHTDVAATWKLFSVPLAYLRYSVSVAWIAYPWEGLLGPPWCVDTAWLQDEGGCHSESG